MLAILGEPARQHRMRYRMTGSGRQALQSRKTEANIFEYRERYFRRRTLRNCIKCSQGTLESGRSAPDDSAYRSCWTGSPDTSSRRIRPCQREMLPKVLKSVRHRSSRRLNACRISGPPGKVVHAQQECCRHTSPLYPRAEDQVAPHKIGVTFVRNHTALCERCRAVNS